MPQVDRCMALGLDQYQLIHRHTEITQEKLGVSSHFSHCKVLVVYVVSIAYY